MVIGARRPYKTGWWWRGAQISRKRLVNRFLACEISIFFFWWKTCQVVNCLMCFGSGLFGFCLKWRKKLDKEGKRERRLRCCRRRELWCCFSFQVGLSRYVLIPETVMTYIQGQLLQAECFIVIGKKDPRCRGVLWIRACLRVDLHSRKVVPLRALLSIELSREFL